MAQKALLGRFQFLYPKLCLQTCFGNCQKHRKCSYDNTDKEDNTNVPFSFKCVNEVKLLGHVGQDPKKFPISNRFITYFSLATSRYYYDKSDFKQRITTWHNIVVRNSNLQDYVLKYISKGARVYVSGYLDDQNFDVDDLLLTKGSIHIVADEVILIKRSRHSYNENSPFFIDLKDVGKV